MKIKSILIFIIHESRVLLLLLLLLFNYINFFFIFTHPFNQTSKNYLSFILNFSSFKHNEKLFSILLFLFFLSTFFFLSLFLSHAIMGEDLNP